MDCLVFLFGIEWQLLVSRSHSLILESLRLHCLLIMLLVSLFSVTQLLLGIRISSGGCFRIARLDWKWLGSAASFCLLLHDVFILLLIYQTLLNVNEALSQQFFFTWESDISIPCGAKLLLQVSDASLELGVILSIVWLPCYDFLAQKVDLAAQTAGFCLWGLELGLNGRCCLMVLLVPAEATEGTTSSTLVVQFIVAVERGSPATALDVLGLEHAAVRVVIW